MHHENLVPVPWRTWFLSIARTEEALIPRFVLREAVVNATMHRDYRVASSVQIIRYSDRIEIRNPGRSLKPADELGQGGSMLRNPDIAQILYQLQLAEAMGSGLHRIRTALAERDLPTPTFESSTRPERFVATFRFEEPESPKLSGESHKTISEGHKPSEVGHPTSELPAEVARILAKFSSELRKRVEEARAQHRVPGVQQLIQDVCSVQAFSATELADLLDRERSRLVRSHLKPLVEGGVLELTHPENPRHPKQAYRTVGEIE